MRARRAAIAALIGGSIVCAAAPQAHGGTRGVVLNAEPGGALGMARIAALSTMHTSSPAGWPGGLRAEERNQADQAGQVNGHAKSARIVTDEVGRRVAIPAEVNRVVTLSADLAETMYALGLGDRLAGDSSDADVPAAAKQKPHVGGAQNPNLEAIVALHPDLVLASTSINRRATVDALERLGIAVYASDPHTVRGMLESFAHVADAMGEPAQGAQLVARLQKRLAALQAQLAERPLVHVLFVVWAQPLITIGQNTFIADALRWAGAESVVVSSENWPNLSFEEVIRLQPDYIVVPVGTGGMSAELADLRSRADWRQVEAVELGHVAGVSDAALRPSPGLIDAIEQLARELHPEAFAGCGGEGTRAHLTPEASVRGNGVHMHAHSGAEKGVYAYAHMQPCYIANRVGASAGESGIGEGGECVR